MERTREQLVAADRRHLWRPYTSSDDHAAMDPLVVVGAEGPWLIDASGRRLLDGNGSWWSSNLGHGHPRLRRALARQAETLMHCAFAGVTHEPAVALAEELVAVAPPGLTRVFYGDDGSTAVEVAAKIAFQLFRQNGQPERTRFLALDGAFHGDTFGAMSLGGVSELQGVFGPLLFDVARAPSPDDGGWEAVVDGIEATLERDGDTFAAVVVEPLVQGAAGMRMWTPEQLRRVREATTRAGCLLIADEVFTGFGRTGRMWACDHAGVTPDLLCSAKGLSGGVLPFSATLATEAVHAGFSGGKERALMHGHTFFGNPLGAAVAREVLAIYREEDVLGGVARRARRIAEAFDRIDRIEGVSGARTLGMIGAADLGDGGYLGARGWRVFEEARTRGALLRPLGDTVYVCPCLTIDDADLTHLLEVLETSIRVALA